MTDRVSIQDYSDWLWDLDLNHRAGLWKVSTVIPTLHPFLIQVPTWVQGSLSFFSFPPSFPSVNPVLGTGLGKEWAFNTR